MRILKSTVFLLIIGIICSIGTTAYAMPKDIEDRINKWVDEVDKLPEVEEITLEENDETIMKLADEFKNIRLKLDDNKEFKEDFFNKTKTAMIKFDSIMDINNKMYIFRQSVSKLNESSNVDNIKYLEKLYKEANFSEKQLKSLDKEIKIIEDFKKKLSGNNNEKKENTDSKNSDNKTNEQINKDKSENKEEDKKKDEQKQDEPNKEVEDESETALALNKDEPTNSDNSKLEDTVSTKLDSNNNIKYIIGGIVVGIIIILLIVRYLKIKKDKRQGYVYYTNNEWFKIKKK